MTPRDRLRAEAAAENPDRDRLWSVEMNGVVVDGTQLTHGDARKLLALVEACEAVEAAAKASEDLEDSFWGNDVPFTTAEYRKQSDVLEAAHVAAIEAYRAALATLTHPEAPDASS